MGRRRNNTLDCPDQAAAPMTAPAPRSSVDDQPEIMDPDYRVLIERRLARVRSGSFATETQVAAVFRRLDP